MSRGGRAASVRTFRRRIAARFRSLRIHRHTTIQPAETTMSSTQATVREGSVRNSRRGR